MCRGRRIFVVLPDVSLRLCLCVHGPLANNTAISCHDYVPPTAHPRDMAFFPSRTPGRLVVLVFLASALNNICAFELFCICLLLAVATLPCIAT